MQRSANKRKKRRRTQMTNYSNNKLEEPETKR